jgi:glycosyltransferase involved in cell wall biosynthesis
MTRVLISAYACDPSKGSEPGNGWNWAVGIAQRGYIVHVLTNSRGKKEIEKKIKEDHLENLNLHFHYVDHSRFWSKAYYLNFILMYCAYWLWQNKIFNYSKNQLKTIKFDLVHHVTWGSLKIGSKLHTLGYPMLFGPVGGGQQTPLNYRAYLGKDYYKEKFRNRIGTLVLRFNPFSKSILKKCKILVTNRDTQNIVSKLSKISPELIFDAAISSPINNNIQKQIHTNLNLLWVGRIYGFKGLRLIVSALYRLEKNDLKKIKLTIVGDGPDRDGIEKLVEQYNLRDVINFIGMIPYKEVENYYRESDAFIYTSLRDSFPSQILEAQLWKLPVITLNLHGQELMVNEKTGIKCSVGTPEKTVIEIRDAIVRLLNNPTVRINMGNEAYLHAINQTWDRKINYVVNQYYPK